METREKLLKKLMSKRQWHEGSGIEQQLAYNYKSDLTKGRLSIEKQQEILKKLGYVIAQEEKWSKK